MMTRTKKIIGFLAAALAVAILWAPAAAAAPSADKVIARYTKAQGKKALRRVTSTTVVGSVAGDDAARHFRQQLSEPDRFRQEIEGSGAVDAEGYNGKSAWRCNASGVRTLVDLDAQHARLHALLANARFQELSRRRVAARALGETVVKGRRASVIEFALEGAREQVYFDATSGLPVVQQRTVDGRVEETYYSDYRRVDGLLEPFSIQIVAGGRETLVSVERVEHNVAPDESAFRVPTAIGSRPLPDLTALVTSLRANQAKVEELQEHYAFRETRTERRDDGRGGTMDSETRVYRVVPVAGRLVRELLAVNGREIPPAEREKERRRVGKQLEEAIAKRAKERARAEQAAAEGKAEDADLTIATFLRLSEISSVRRERLHGRELLAFDFEPRADYKPKTMAENIVGKLAGTIWVDEAALQVVRLEARLTKKAKIAGGLFVSLAPDSKVAMEQAMVNDEVWLPSYREIAIAGRAFLLKKFSQNTLSRFSDFERFGVDADATLEVPEDEPKP
jgi:outer membrane lipoprotein-sorting protein